MKNLLHKTKSILIQTVPIIVMVLLIPAIPNDFVLLGAYALIIAVSFSLRYDKQDWVFFIFGLFAMTASEALFINTGVEIFQRNSLFGLMPIWLPILWAYGFVVMRRAVHILESK